VRDGNLPEDSELRLGSAQLASGRRITPVWGTDPVAWVTDEPVQDVATLWLALSAMAAQTGLQRLYASSIPIQRTCSAIRPMWRSSMIWTRQRS
jgi:hypothetical protein